MEPAAPGRTRRRRRLRAAAAGVRRGRPSASREQGDPDLLALVADPYSDVDEVHARLDDLLTAFEERGDRRAVFLSVYARMTAAIADRLQQGYFDDSAWVSEYLVSFANLYREAVYNYEAGAFEAVPRAWQLAFEAAKRGDSLVVQDAALGVNAHINYDLALTLDTVGVDPSRLEKYADHKLVTDVIGDVLDDAQDALAARNAPGLETVDESFGRFDEWLLVFSIDECRDSAWRTALALQSRSSVRCRLARWLNDVTSTGAAHLILASLASDRVHERLHGLEASSAE